MSIAAFILGFAGSFHCLGMCSPLVMAVSNIRSNAMKSRILYNAGRILMYGILGFTIGTTSVLIPLHKFQNILSLVLGVVVLGIAFFGVASIRIPIVTSLLQKFTIKLKTWFGKFLHQKNSASLVMLGMLNGILPCGLTVLALTFCITLSSVDGFLYMLAFGLGTLPVMLGATSVIQALLRRFSSLPMISTGTRNFTTSMLVISGCLLIARVLLFHHQHLVNETQEVIDITMCR